MRSDADWGCKRSDCMDNNDDDAMEVEVEVDGSDRDDDEK